jgi:nitroreductase
MTVATDVWEEILGVARYAPSPHNVQPWRVRLISSHEAELLFDLRRTLPKEDLTGSFLLSAMGMFLEAIDIMAASHGLRLQYQLKESPEWFASQARVEGSAHVIPFADLRLTSGDSAEIVYPPELFLRRRTSRLSLSETPPAVGAVQALASLAERYGQRYWQTQDAGQIERILGYNIDAVFHDMNSPHYHDEITSWFRFTDESAKKHRDGLDWRCMNLTRGEFWLSARLPRLLQMPLSRSVLKRRYRKQLGVIPTMGMLSAGFFVPENAIDSGRFLMHFWLEAAKHNLYLHPYGNLVTNPEAAAKLRQEVGRENVWLVFKLGYSDEPPRSYRRHVEEILLD